MPLMMCTTTPVPACGPQRAVMREPSRAGVQPSLASRSISASRLPLWSNCSCWLRCLLRASILVPAVSSVVWCSISCLLLVVEI